MISHSLASHSLSQILFSPGQGCACVQAMLVACAQAMLVACAQAMLVACAQAILVACELVGPRLDIILMYTILVKFVRKL